MLLLSWSYVKWFMMRCGYLYKFLTGTLQNAFIYLCFATVIVIIIIIIVVNIIIMVSEDRCAAPDSWQTLLSIINQVTRQ